MLSGNWIEDKAKRECNRQLYINIIKRSAHMSPERCLPADVLMLLDHIKKLEAAMVRLSHKVTYDDPPGVDCTALGEGEIAAEWVTWALNEGTG